jgi:N-acylglucosamine-6-phosphate 2-epimerase
VEVRRAELGPDAVLVGAGCLARERFGFRRFDLEEFLEAVRGRLIVSCQALADEPLHGPEQMARMARAAQAGGAAAIRANGPTDIRAIKRAVDLPLIGLYKDGREGVFITPTFEHARAVADAGADVIALDGTDRPRPDGVSLPELVGRIHRELKRPVMADVSTFEEGKAAARSGADLVGTTLSGYTPYSLQQDEPDLDLVRELAHHLPTPAIAEGRIHTPDQARKAIAAGAHTVVVGGAITRPQQITRSFVNALSVMPE